MSDSTSVPAEATPAPTGTNEEKSTPSLNPKETRATVERLVGEGKKAIALKQWEEGVGKYADALDHQRQLVGDFDPSMAPLLLSYGKALYELAFSQAGVMGKDKEKDEGSKEADEAVREATLEDAPDNKNFVFSADAPSDDEAEDEEEGAAGVEAEGEGEGDDEPEDDFNAAWEVLDVARTIYQSIVNEKAEGSQEVKDIKLNLADTYLALGDVSCETENFPQAVQDYTSALEIKSALLPSSSRALASVHYQLATVLEFTPGRRADALSHVERALEGFRARQSELLSSSSENTSEEVKKLSDKEKENELNDVKGLVGDLEVKIEELKMAPPANDLVAEGINHLLGQPSSSANASGSGSGEKESGPVNDLTSMVKKKKPKITAAANKVVENGKEEVNKVVEAAKETVEAAQPTIEAAQEKASDLLTSAKEEAASLASSAQEQATALASVAQEKVAEIAVKAGGGLKAAGEKLEEEGEKRKGEDGDGEEEERPAKKSKTA